MPTAASPTIRHLNSEVPKGGKLGLTTVDCGAKLGSKLLVLKANGVVLLLFANHEKLGEGTLGLKSANAGLVVGLEAFCGAEFVPPNCHPPNGVFVDPVVVVLPKIIGF